jgi:hypothetical protein
MAKRKSSFSSISPHWRDGWRPRSASQIGNGTFDVSVDFKMVMGHEKATA